MSRCKAPVLIPFVGGVAQCKRKSDKRYCYQHKFLETFNGWYINQNFPATPKKGK